jgi:hypothetical protein
MVWQAGGQHWHATGDTGQGDNCGKNVDWVDSSLPAGLGGAHGVSPCGFVAVRHPRLEWLNRFVNVETVSRPFRTRFRLEKIVWHSAILINQHRVGWGVVVELPALPPLPDSFKAKSGGGLVKN